MWLGIKLEAWLTIAAILLGPLLAFEVQRERDNRRERRGKKLDIFRRLMMTLKVSLNPNHIDAINSIQVEFHKDKKVLSAWRLYVSHLNDRAGKMADEARRQDKRFDLLVDVVYEIAQRLRYKDIDRTAIRDNNYVPQGYVDVEEELHRTRKGWLEVLGGRRPLTMTMVGPVHVEKPLPPPPEPPALSPGNPARGR